MLALRYAAVLALALWTGGLFVVGALVAPAVFAIVGTQGADGRMLAGAAVGEILRRLNPLAYACAALTLVSLAARGVLGPRPRRFAIRMAGLIVMSAVSLYAGLALAPRIAALQQATSVPPSTLAENDPRRVEFGRLHGLSVSLQLIPLLGGLALLFWELKD